MESLWRKQTGEIEARTGSKEKKEHWEIIVIGAGMAGILTAYYLKKAGLQVLVLEADRIASGQTGRTTAKITSQHGLKYDDLIKTAGREKAILYAEANQKAIDEYERLIREEKIDCQFKRCPAYLYVEELERDEDHTDIKKIAKNNKQLTNLTKEAQAVSDLGLPASFTPETELPFPVAGAIRFENQARFSPLEFIRHLTKELEIWENTQVIGIRGNEVITKGEKIQADKIVVAAHYPFVNRFGFYFMRQHQERSYVLALSGCKEIEGMYLGLGDDGLSFRQAGEYLLLGGGGHRTGENKSGGKYAFLEQAAKQYFPEGRIEARWSAQDCMPHDGIPFIGKYSIFTPNLYVATGFQKWGMTSSMVAAQILRDTLCQKENPYAKLFTPQRCYFRAAGKLLFDTGVSIKGLTQGLFGKRCSHMGCKLEWNPDEQSWDCPCHGSRFDKEGKLLDNPALKNKEQ